MLYMALVERSTVLFVWNSEHATETTQSTPPEAGALINCCPNCPVLPRLTYDRVKVVRATEHP